MLKLGMEEGVPIEHRMVTKSIENAQKKVEAHNFEIRKQLLEYDDVMNKQREIIYQHRGGVLGGEDVSEDVPDMISDVVESLVTTYCPEDQYAESWDLTGLRESLQGQFGVDIMQEDDVKDMGLEGLLAELRERVQQAYTTIQQERDEAVGVEIRQHLERSLLLQVIDHHWKDHLLGMDQLRDGIGLRGYGQKDPLAEYKREGFDMFAVMMDRIKSDALERVFKVQIVKGERPDAVEEVDQPLQISLNRGEAAAPRTVQRAQQKVGRNDPCPCGSGKKYKKCHGA